MNGASKGPNLLSYQTAVSCLTRPAFFLMAPAAVGSAFSSPSLIGSRGRI